MSIFGNFDYYNSLGEIEKQELRNAFFVKDDGNQGINYISNRNENKLHDIVNIYYLCNKITGKSIIELSKEAKKHDNTFEEFDFSSSKYTEFTPVGYIRKSNVNWGKPLGSDIKPEESNALVLVSRLESIAVEMTRGRLPNEPEDSQKFGMIVSAYTDKLLRAYIFQNS